ncbi:hypothetical protein BP422_12080 [Brevibacillus formosus]|uniref:YopX protein domain-containing protein n=1 Tax=Brevibacillus formosus TaxID=54913 RepID=A0A220MHZ2_9BACL|nr:YopX family protein [Brevibacillus formosus]ASJ54220.1 hypothetical protein BP422_12080 [Brevibacillus formosus]
MREIKFRGKRIDNGEWVYGYFLYGAILDQYVIWTDHENWIVDPETVGQLTGLRDKNGIDIYEDDALEDDEDIAKVVFEMGQFMAFYRNGRGEWKPYGTLLKYMVDHDGRVVGNIYECPELAAI